jgi:hypothetical protein
MGVRQSGHLALFATINWRIARKKPKNTAPAPMFTRYVSSTQNPPSMRTKAADRRINVIHHNTAAR